jgi:hypothetical protein
LMNSSTSQGLTSYWNLSSEYAQHNQYRASPSTSHESHLTGKVQLTLQDLRWRKICTDPCVLVLELECLVHCCNRRLKIGLRALGTIWVVFSLFWIQNFHCQGLSSWGTICVTLTGIQLILLWLAMRMSIW